MDASIEKVVAVEPSRHGNVVVVDAGDRLILRLGGLFGNDQGVVSKTNLDAVLLEYVRCAAVGTALVPRLRRALVIGLGTGTFPRLLRRGWPRAVVDVVELDPTVLRVAQRWFSVHPDARLHITVDDGARFVQSGLGQWDLAFVDAYGPYGLPRSLQTGEFFHGLRACIAPGGAAIMNLAVGDRATERRLVAEMVARFASCATLRAPRSGNLLVLAATTQLPPRHELEQLARRCEREHHLGFRLSAVAARLRPVVGWPQPDWAAEQA